MNKDKLEEIKNMPVWDCNDDDILWLRSELEIARKKLQIADDNYMMLEMQLDRKSVV